MLANGIGWEALDNAKKPLTATIMRFIEFSVCRYIRKSMPTELSKPHRKPRSEGKPPFVFLSH